MAAELVRLKVDVLVTQGGAATVAAKQATSTIPIVMSLASGDAVATGMIASLARPGQNVTGLTDESIQLSAKRMEMLKEAVRRRLGSPTSERQRSGDDATLNPRDREGRAALQ